MTHTAPQHPNIAPVVSDKLWARDGTLHEIAPVEPMNKFTVKGQLHWRVTDVDGTAWIVRNELGYIYGVREEAAE